MGPERLDCRGEAAGCCRGRTLAIFMSGHGHAGRKAPAHTACCLQPEQGLSSVQCMHLVSRGIQEGGPKAHSRASQLITDPPGLSLGSV